MAKRVLPNHLAGPEGLALAIIATAAHDLHSANDELRRDAEKFFAGSWYADLMALVDKPAHWRPDV